MQKLKSPNVVQLLDVMETSNNYYIIQRGYLAIVVDLDGLAIETWMSEWKEMHLSPLPMYWQVLSSLLKMELFTEILSQQIFNW
jgi:hypothetical protein